MGCSGVNCFSSVFCEFGDSSCCLGDAATDYGDAESFSGGEPISGDAELAGDDSCGSCLLVEQLSYEAALVWRCYEY